MSSESELRAEIAKLVGLLKEARKIVKASSIARAMNTDWQQRSADALKKYNKEKEHGN